MTSPATLRESRGFARLWTASTASAFGSYITVLAIQVLVVDVLAGDAVDVGLVNAARWVPYLLFGLLAGVLVDRVRRRPVLVATDLLSAVALSAIPVLSATGSLTVGWLAGVMAVFGLCTVVGDAAFQSFVPRLVPTRLLGPAHARLDQSDAVAQASGPAVAGGLVQLLGAPLAVLVDAVSYLVSAVLLITVKVDEPRGESRRRVRDIGPEIREGLRWIYRHATLRPLALSTHAWFACSAVAGAVMTPFALRTLHLSPATLGLALAAAGVGALAGASVAVRLGDRWGAGHVIIGARLGTGTAWGLMAACGAAGTGRRRVGALRVRAAAARAVHGCRERQRDGLLADRDTRPVAGSDQRHPAVRQPRGDRRRRAAGRPARRRSRLRHRPRRGRGDPGRRRHRLAGHRGATGAARRRAHAGPR